MFETLDELIGLWPSEADFARDIDLKPSHVAVFKVRRKIPSTYWPAIIAAAQKRSADSSLTVKQRRAFEAVTAEALLAIQVHMAQTA